MRRLLAASFLVFSVVISTNAQWSTTTSPNTFFTWTGNLGLGVGFSSASLPGYRLHFKSTERQPTVLFDLVDATLSFNQHLIDLKPKSNFTGNTPYIAWHNQTGRMAFFGWEKDFFNLTLEQNMTFGINGGNVGIGVSDTRGFKLAVWGKVIAEEVVVALKSNWPDYVFENTYRLPKLSEIEQFILANKHLPGIPSAAEIKEKWVELGEFQAQLLEKVEELTLHLIELEKQVKKLEADNAQKTSDIRKFQLQLQKSQ